MYIYMNSSHIYEGIRGGQKRVLDPSGAGVIDSCELPDVGVGTLQEQQVHMSTGLSLQPYLLIFNRKVSARLY